MQTYLNYTVLRDTCLKIQVFFVLSFTFFSPTRLVLAQDTVRARKNLEILAAKEMMGRGYLFDGHTKAAGFIQGEFKKAGLKDVSGSYTQNFFIQQNLFPQEPEVWLNGRKLKVGLDFIPSADASSLKGEFQIHLKDTLKPGQNLNPTYSSKKPCAYLMNEKAKIPPGKDVEKQVFIRLKDKLTHTLSEEASLPLVLEIKKSAFLPGDSILKVSIKSKLKSGIKTQNVLGYVDGTLVKDSFLVFCAHYDHLGALGKEVYFPGANDNGSGTAMLIEMAYAIAQKPLKYSVLFIAFSGEEAGLLGSFYYTYHPLVPLERTKFVMNMDLMGFGETGATVVNGTIYPALFERLKAINSEKKYLTELQVRGKAANSDHYPFSEKGVPAFFIYSLGGPGYYHDVYDRPETVTFSRFEGLFRLIRDFLEGF